MSNGGGWIVSEMCNLGLEAIRPDIGAYKGYTASAGAISLTGRLEIHLKNNAKRK